MRMMLRAVMNTQAGNAAIRDGSIGPSLRQLVDQLHPEAAYFFPEDGRRACLMVFDMTDSAQLPVITEQLFLTMGAQVTCVPCMNMDELVRGLSEMQAASAPQGGDRSRVPDGAGIG
ncbi:hypothetical protein [Modestobacter sp. NPDC049651]|uniref:hypothetical protein n=1 Tax=unclassified Modestobacter TaxID=2643866 RepID=UPI0033E53C33